jgi:hypothetical protein
MQHTTEQRVGYSATWCNWLLIIIYIKWCTIRRRFRTKVSKQLVIITWLDISSMVLVEVCQSIVHVYFTLHKTHNTKVNYNIPISVQKCVCEEKIILHIQGATIYFPEWLQRFAGVLSQANSCTQARLDTLQLAFTWATNQICCSFPSSRASSMCPRYTVGWKMGDRNLKQRINIKFCVKIGKSAREQPGLLTLPYGKHTMKRLSVFEWHMQFT